MNRTEAMAELRKRWGTKARYEVRNDAPDEDERAAIRTQLPALKAAYTEASLAATQRRDAVLAADPEYQALRAASKAAHEAHAKAQSKMLRHRYTIGYVDSIGAGFSCFLVQGSGESWTAAFREADEAQAKVDARKKK